MATKPKQAKQNAVSAAVQSVVAPVAAPVAASVVAAPVVDLVAVREMGVQAVAINRNTADLVGKFVTLLKGQPFPIWEQVKVAFLGGAVSAGYEDTDEAKRKLWSRYCIQPLSVLGIEKPKSETSSAARVVSDATKAKQDKVAEAKKALESMPIAALVKEKDDKNTSEARVLELLGEKVRREKVAAQAADKANKEKCAKRYKACLDIINAHKLDYDKLGTMFVALSKCIATSGAQAGTIKAKKA